MKKIIFILILTAMLLMPMALAKDSKDKEPVDKITIIHYRDGTVKVNGGETNSASCYKLMGIKWNSLPVSYVINPTNNQGLTQDFVTNAISSAAETWDSATSKELFNNAYTIDTFATFDSSASDGVNEYVFGPYSNSNVIAITNIWYTRNTKAIVDYDVLFNTYYNWYDCTTTTCNAANRGMDLQNIATHETGHGLGLSDIYSNKCSEVTMYGYSSYGEIKERTLDTADIAGLRAIYGS